MERKKNNTRHLQREINRLKSELVRLGAMVEDSLCNSIRAMFDRDIDIAKKVIKNDTNIDIKEVEVEEECLKILALYQPVAIDLRYIIGILKVNNDLERIGDLAVNIAKSTKLLVFGKPIEPLPQILTSSQIVQKMLNKSLDAFIQLDVDLANQLLKDDDEVDHLHKKVSKKVAAQVKEDSVNAEKWMQMLAISRYLERAADHTTNIAEDILYMVEGKIKRHSY